MRREMEEALRNRLRADLGPVLVQSTGAVLVQSGPRTGTGSALDQYWFRADLGPVLVQHWTSTGSVLEQYWFSTGPVLVQHWSGTDSALVSVLGSALELVLRSIIKCTSSNTLKCRTIKQKGVKEGFLPTL